MTAPWRKGTHPEYEAFVIEVHVRKDQDGHVHSFRGLQDATDYATTEKMKGSHGMQESAWALLMESVRAELMLQVLVNLTQKPEFKEKLLDENLQKEIEEELSKTTLEQLHRGLEEITLPLVREAMETMKDGLGKQKG